MTAPDEAATNVAVTRVTGTLTYVLIEDDPEEHYGYDNHVLSEVYKNLPQPLADGLTALLGDYDSRCCAAYNCTKQVGGYLREGEDAYGRETAHSAWASSTIVNDGTRTWVLCEECTYVMLPEPEAHPERNPWSDHMTAMTINADAMSAIVSKAILEGISTEQRDLLLEQAVTALVTPVKPPGSYQSTPATTPLQEAFARAAQTVVNRVATEMVENNEAFVRRVRDLVGESISVASQEDYGLKDKIAHAVAGALIDWKSAR